MSRKQSKKPRYTEESKRQIINLHLSGIPATTLAKEYGLNRQTIYRWRKLYDPFINMEQETASLKDYEKLQKRIQKKIDRLKMEEEIIKKGYHEIEPNNKYTTQNIVAFIHKYQDQYPIQLIYKLLHISHELITTQLINLDTTKNTIPNKLYRKSYKRTRKIQK